MCRLQTWDEEDDDHSLNTGNQLEHDEMRVEVRVAMLRAQIAGIEARVERLEEGCCICKGDCVSFLPCFLLHLCMHC